jgi:hypothetical protein
MNQHLRSLVFSVILVAALLCAAFLLPNPGGAIFMLTGEEGVAKQALAVFQWAFHWMRPLPQTADNAVINYTDEVPFGVNTFLNQEVEPQKREQIMQMVQAAGFQWIRQSFPWYDIEIHGKGDFEDRRHMPYRSAWDKYDHIVELSEKYSVNIIARLEAPPSWSRHDGDTRGAFGPPDDIDDYADYVRAVVTRYKGRIRYYQIWNEPNIYPEWGKQKVDPEGYSTLLCSAYVAVKSVDSDAVIISGAMAPTVELGTWNPTYDGNNMMDVVFLQRMYDAGAGDCFDIMAVNDYMLWSGPTDHRMRITQVNYSRPLWVRDVMVANDDAEKPIWISEMNSNAVPENIEPRFGRVTLDQQARYAPLAFERMQQQWPWVGVTTVWFLKPVSDENREQPFYYFRLVEPDFEPLPVYTSLLEYINGLRPTLYAGHHQESTWQLYYTGSWEEVEDANAVLGFYKQTNVPGSSIYVTWHGKSLILQPGSGKGSLRITNAAGNERIIKLNGKQVVLDQVWDNKPASIQLTAVSGIVSVDDLFVR